MNSQIAVWIVVMGTAFVLVCAAYVIYRLFRLGQSLRLLFPRENYSAVKREQMTRTREYLDRQPAPPDEGSSNLTPDLEEEEDTRLLQTLNRLALISVDGYSGKRAKTTSNKTARSESVEQDSFEDQPVP